jgi:hypothetical protein
MAIPRLSDFAGPDPHGDVASGTVANDLELDPSREMSASDLAPKSLQSVERDARGRFVPTSKRPREVTALKPSLAQGLTDDIA